MLPLARLAEEEARGILEFLTTAELLRIYQLSQATRQAVPAEVLWESARGLVPDFVLAPECLSPGGAPRVAALLPLLRQVTPVKGVPLALGEPSALVAGLRFASAKATEHRARRGRAQALLARLWFPAAAEPSLDPGADSWAPCCSAPTLFECRSCPSNHLVQLHFAVRRGSLLISARDDGLPAERIGLPAPQATQGIEQGTGQGRFLVVDVTSAAPEVSIDTRAVVVQINGPWVARTPGGVRAPAGTSAGAAAAALARPGGVLCAVVLRDRGGGPCTGESAPSPGLLAAVPPAPPPPFWAA